MVDFDKCETLGDIPTKQIKVQSLGPGHFIVLENGRVCWVWYAFDGGRLGPRQQDNKYFLTLPRDKTGKKRKKRFFNPGELVTILNLRWSDEIPSRLMNEIHGIKESDNISVDY